MKKQQQQNTKTEGLAWSIDLTHSLLITHIGGMMLKLSE